MTDKTSHSGQAILPGDGVVVVDREGRIMGSNQAARQLLRGKIEPGEILRVENLFEGPYVGRARMALDAALSEGEATESIQARIQEEDGQSFACECGINPVLGNFRQINGVILTVRDLDFALFSEEAVEENGAPPHIPRLGYHALFENLAEGLFTINRHWRITSFNQRASQITGFKREEVLGRFCWDIFRSDVCQSGCPLRTTLETGVIRMDQDVRMFDKGGKRITVLVNTSVVKDKTGNVVGAVESFRLLATAEPEPDTEGGAGRKFSDIIGVSPPMRRIFDLLPQVAQSEASVLITGESGTGKELFARAIHNHSGRKENPFVAVNCSALAESLLESELFGHEKAAFTGAVRSKVGRFELAKGGTLFLDEIGDLKPELQVKLLRVLEQRLFERVGGTRLISLEARIIAATNQDLQQALRTGSFREDLYYRLRTVPLNIPPLRERPEDIGALVAHFIERFNRETGKEVRAVDSKVMQLFMSYPWPGNVRELERVLEYAFVFAKGPVIFSKNLPELTGQPAGEAAGQPAIPAGADQADLREQIMDALKRSNGRRAEAARLLGISRTSLWRRMKDLGLD